MRCRQLHLRPFLTRNSGCTADIKRAALAEGLEEAVEEDLGLAFFVAGDVLINPSNVFGKLLLTIHPRESKSVEIWRQQQTS